MLSLAVYFRLVSLGHRHYHPPFARSATSLQIDLSKLVEIISGDGKCLETRRDGLPEGVIQGILGSEAVSDLPTAVTDARTAPTGHAEILVIPGSPPCL